MFANIHQIVLISTPKTPAKLVYFNYLRVSKKKKDTQWKK